MKAWLTFKKICLCQGGQDFCVRWAWSCTLVPNLGLTSAGIRMNPGQTETRFCLCSFLKLISFFLHYAYFHLCANESTGLFQGIAWKISVSFGHLSEILQSIWCLLWRVAVKDCRVRVFICVRGERAPAHCAFVRLPDCLAPSILL